MRALLLAVCVLGLPAIASEPGQPLDCSDWVFVEPGMSCVTHIPYPCGGGELEQARCSNTSHGLHVLNDGDTLFYYRVGLGACNGEWNAWRHELRRLHGEQQSVVAYITDRCSPIGQEYVESLEFNFDELAGRLYVGMKLLSRAILGSGNNPPYNPGTGYLRLSLSGFTTRFEVLQGYSVQPAQIGFRVPYMPEGMAAADHFDTFYGPLTRPLDFSQAHGLACGYPAAAPHVGDYLEVADPLPDPAPGTGRYYVTAATYQGQTRYGRKTTAGAMTGRDPALLPSCNP